MKKALLAAVIVVALAVVTIVSVKQTNISTESINQSNLSINQASLSVKLSTARISLFILQTQIITHRMYETYGVVSPSLQPLLVLLEQADQTVEFLNKFVDFAHKIGENEAAEAGAEASSALLASVRPLIEDEKYEEAGKALSNLLTSDNFQFLIEWQEDLLE